MQRPEDGTMDRQLIRKLQQDFQQEKDRIQQQCQQQCQKEKHKLSQQLNQKNALDISYLKEEILQQFRLEKEIIEKRLRQQSHKELEETRRDLLMKYREEEDHLRTELSLQYQRSLEQMKQDLLLNYYNYQTHLPAISQTSPTQIDDSSNQAATMGFSEWKRELFSSEIANLTLQLQRQCSLSEKPVSSSLLPFFEVSPGFEVNKLVLVLIAVCGASLAMLFFSRLKTKRGSNRKREVDLSIATSDHDYDEALMMTPHIVQDLSPLMTAAASSSFPRYEAPFSAVKSVTPPRLSSSTYPPLEAQYDVFLSFARYDAELDPVCLQLLLHSLQREGFSVYYPSVEGEEGKERLLEALDRSRVAIVCVTEEYHNRTNPQLVDRLAGPQDLCRWEFNYLLGAMSGARILPVICQEKMSKKTHWKHRFRSDLSALKPIPFFQEKDRELRLQEILHRLRAMV